MNTNLFINFLKSLNNGDNTLLIEAVMEGYHNVFGGKSGMGSIDMYFPEYSQTPEDVKPATTVNYMPNLGNEYFTQTIPNNNLNVVNSSQSGVRGGRTIGYPPAGKTSDSLQNPMTRRNMGVQNSNDAPAGNNPTVGGAGVTGMGYPTGAGGA